MANHKFFGILLLALLWSLTAQTQIIYNGHISDVATGQDLKKVSIKFLPSTDSISSNYFGDFIIRQEASTPTPSDLSYRFYYNSILWEGDPQLSLSFFAMDGRLIYENKQLGNAGVFQFPRLAFGVYLIQVRANGEAMTYKAFSDEQKVTIVDTRAVRHQDGIKATKDSLFFSKEGYFPRTIVMPGKDTVVEVKMLRGNYEDLHYFNELINPIAYDLISGAPSRSNFGDVQAVKFIYNTKDELLYYMNTKRYQLHYTFAEQILDYNQGHFTFNRTQYLDTPDRFLLMGSINYYEALDRYVVQFVTANDMDCATLDFLFDKILTTSFIGDKLLLFSNRSEWDICLDIPKITPEELFEGQNYQALNLTENYGYLTKIDLEDLDHTYLSRRDIVLLNGVPNDVSVVAGIITTEFQTPLSHINVLSHGRGTPNMALKDGWDNPTLDSLLGQLVYLDVQADSFFIRKANLAEATVFWNLNAPQDSIHLAKNSSLQGLVDLETADHSFVDRIGGKAANFAEMLNVKIGETSIPTPESSFAIPFYYYEQHMEQAGLNAFVNQMFSNPAFAENPGLRKVMLEVLQERIKDHPLDPELVDLVMEHINHFETFPSFRFRSSTNAEDLEVFSGAGLYGSYSAKKDNANKTVEKAIKKVWASLWNFRAFEERSYYKINHRSCAMGILVTRSFPNEDANGVLITQNLYNSNPGFIINVQYKENSIVFPEPGVLNDQLILFTWSIVPQENYMIEYLTFSNVPELMGQRVMTDDELKLLGDYSTAIQQYFFNNTPHNCNCAIKDFGLDIEFKIDSQVSPRKLYIKQVRRY